jgi:Domain of unknown function (DUF3859)
VAYLFLVRRMKTLSVLLLLLLLAGGTVQAQKVTGAEILEYGTLKKVVSAGRIDSPNTIAGKANYAIAEQLVQMTSTINASIGTTFGILVKLLGEPEAAVVTAHFRCTHPRLTDPASLHTGEIDEWDSPRPIGTPRYVSYTFDYEWELVPGKWTLQVLQDGKVLAEKTFYVVAR